MTPILTGILFVIISYLLYLYWRRISKLNEMTKNIPSPKGYPIFGNIFDFRRTTEDFWIYAMEVYKMGPIVKFWMGPFLFIAISAPDAVEEILLSDKHINKSIIYPILAKNVNGVHNLIVAAGDVWRYKRKLINPAFSFNNIGKYIDVFITYGKVLADVLKSEIGKPGFNIDVYSNLCTTDIILETMCETKMDFLKTKNKKFINALHRLESLALMRATKPWFYPYFIFTLTEAGREQKILGTYIRSTINTLLVPKKKKFQQEEEQNTFIKQDISDTKKNENFIHLMFKANLSNDEIIDEIITMIGAGQSTAATAVSFALYNLMKHPHVQEKVINELNEIFDGSYRDPTINDLNRMNYMANVIKETMRLFTVVPYIARKLTEDVHLKSGHTLPASADIIIFVHGLHHNENIYPNPKEFDPERFNEENLSKRPYHTFLPFLFGPRNCIGQKYGMLEMKVMLYYVLINYKILPPSDDSPDIVLKSEIMLRSKTGINIRIEERKSSKSK